jgi:acetyltransferase-like isoleucine patch superfamily enzyme
MISSIFKKYIKKWRKSRIWSKYGNKTFYHFQNNPQISVDGTETYGVPIVEIYDNTAKLHIGRYCSIAGDCRIILGGNHHTRWISTYAFYQEPLLFPTFSKLGVENSIRKGDIKIGNDVWIGRNVLILTGAVIEDGAVIGAGSVVAGHIPAYSIAVGNPCKVIKYRFNPEQIKSLQEIAWWKWPHKKIDENIHLICNEDIDGFIRKAKQ